MMRVEYAGALVVLLNVLYVIFEWNGNLCMLGFNLGEIVGALAVVVVSSPVLNGSVGKRRRGP